MFGDLPPTASRVGLSPRERGVIGAGAVIVALGFFVTRVAMPSLASWRTKTLALETARTRVAHWQGLIEHQDSLTRMATREERALAEQPRRVLHARTTALGASALQTYLQDAVDGAGMLVNRVDVDQSTSTSDTLTAQLSVIGDIQGVARLLETLAHGPRVVTLTRLTVQQNSALRGAADVLQVTIGIQAPLILEGATP